MSEPDVTPYFDMLKAFGFNAKDWIIKCAKSKTLWFSTALTVFGAIETFLPTVQSNLGTHGGEIITGIGIITAVLRFATTNAIADK